MRNLTKLAVVRVRGGIGLRKEVKDTLRMLGLTRVNHCVIIEDSPSYKGMLQKVKDAITWGEISPETLEHLLRKRGRLLGDKRLTDEFVSSNTEFKSIGEFSRALLEGRAKIEDLPGLKKVFRLHPPKGGYGRIKRPIKDGGALGYRGSKINDLILCMS